MRKPNVADTAIFLFIHLMLISTSWADWQIVNNEKLPPLSFQAATSHKKIWYFCRDSSLNIGMTESGKNCRLLFGKKVVQHDFKILVDSEKILYWEDAVSGNHPIGVFDGGPEQFLREKHLCLKAINRSQYLGYVIKKQCYYRTNDHIHHTIKYKVLANYWVESKIIPLYVPFNGTTSWGNSYICRVKHNGVYIPGTTGRGIEQCHFTDELGINRKSEEYEVQFSLPHEWKYLRIIPDNAVKIAKHSPYYICRAKISKHIYIGKIALDKRYCEIGVGDGLLKMKNYQLQLWTNG